MQQKHTWRVAFLLLLGVCLMGAMSVEAAVMVQTVTGMVNFSTDGQQWQALNPGDELQVGQSIQTSSGSEVVLKTEDGSLFFVRENSQLTIVLLEFSSSSRMYRFNLSQGVVVAEVAKLGFAASQNSVTIETAIGTTEATTNENRGASFQVSFDPSVPVWEIYNFEGVVVVNQTGAGVSNMAGLISEDAGTNEGVTFPINIVGASIKMEVQPENALITAKSSIQIVDLVAMLGNYIGMEVTQLDEENQAPITLFLPNGEDVLVLEKKGQRVFIATAPANVILGKADNYLHGRFKFFKELGTFWIWDLCDCGGVDWRPGIVPESIPTPEPIPTRPPESDGSPVQPSP